MKQEMTASEKEAFNNPEIRRKWFQAVKERVKWEDYRAINDFKREYPEHFKFYSKVSRLRSEMKKTLKQWKRSVVKFTSAPLLSTMRNTETK